MNRFENLLKLVLVVLFLFINVNFPIQVNALSDKFHCMCSGRCVEKERGWIDNCDEGCEAEVIDGACPIKPAATISTYHCICDQEPKCRAFPKGAPNTNKCTDGCAGPRDGDCPQEAATAITSTNQPAGDKECPTGYTCLNNPLGGNPTEVPEILGIVIRAAMGVIGSLALLMFVYGGFRWLTSAGNADGVKKGTQTMVWAAIGIIVVFSSYLLLDTFIKYLTGQQ